MCLDSYKEFLFRFNKLEETNLHLNTLKSLVESYSVDLSIVKINCFTGEKIQVKMRSKRP